MYLINSASVGKAILYLSKCMVKQQLKNRVYKFHGFHKAVSSVPVILFQFLDLFKFEITLKNPPLSIHETYMYRQTRSLHYR
jgi:hypothetical protein